MSVATLGGYRRRLDVSWTRRAPSERADGDAEAGGEGREAPAVLVREALVAQGVVDQLLGDGEVDREAEVPGEGHHARRVGHGLLRRLEGRPVDRPRQGPGQGAGRPRRGQ